MSRTETIAAEIVDRGLDDWVPVDSVIGSARESTEGTGDDFRPVAVEAIEYLILGGLMVAGDIGATGFESWSDPPPAMARKVIELCESFAWSPQGGACWLSNTELGTRRAREMSARD